MLNSVASFIPAVYWTIASGVLLTIGDLVLRQWFSSRWELGFALVFLVYMAGIFCMMMSFFSQNIAVATVAAVVANAVFYIIAAYLIFGDTISALKIFGILVGFISLAILELS